MSLSRQRQAGCHVEAATAVYCSASDLSDGFLCVFGIRVLFRPTPGDPLNYTEVTPIPVPVRVVSWIEFDVRFRITL